MIINLIFSIKKPINFYVSYLILFNRYFTIFLNQYNKKCINDFLGNEINN